MKEARTAVCIPEFLAEDFARIDANVIARCQRLDGKRLYLSGATGFFGKNLLALFEYLRALGASFEVTALSRAPERFLVNQPWCRGLSWLKWREGDVSAPWLGQGDYDLVLHAATDTVASAHVDKRAVFEGILAGTRQALAFVAAHGVRRVLLCGSGAQYGAIPVNYAHGIPESSSLACDATAATSAYGEGKRASEMLAALHAETHGFEVINTRCFAFAGPWLPLGGHFAIGNFMGAALAGRPIRLNSQGEAIRSYLYGADLAVWLLLLLLEAPPGAAFNVGSDAAIRIVDLATRIRQLVNPHLSIELGSRTDGEERHVYVPSIERARALGLDAWTDLDLSITRTAIWHRLGAMSPTLKLGPKI